MPSLRLMLCVGTATACAQFSLGQTLGLGAIDTSTPTPPTIPTAQKLQAKSKLSDKERMRLARVQTLLARAGFSPGLVDGKAGRKTRLAIEQYQRAKGVQVTGSFNELTLAALVESDKLAKTEDWTRTLLITQTDLALITGPIPEDWNERAALTVSGYADLTELLSERGWCTQELIQILNPGIDVNSLSAGDQVIIPDVQTKPLPYVARLEISLREQLVMGFDSANQQVSLMHCSIAKLPEKRPIGTFHVQTIVTDPDYTFDPKDWPEVTNVMSKLRIAPGPRTPVGTAWIGLDKPSYGLHGTVRPQDIGKTGSHGCFRLANWDATRLAKAAKIGTLVEVKE